MDKYSIIIAIPFWPKVCANMTSAEMLQLQRTCNDTGIEIFDTKQDSIPDVDDFKDLLNTPIVKITSGILCFFVLTFTNAFNILVSMFEKHGGDPMKRSLINQLTAEIGYGMIIHNTICIPLLMWRIFFGPLYFGIAAFSSFCRSIAVFWIMNHLTAIFVVKALMLFKFSYMAGIDDTFMSRFLLLENLGFLFLSQLSRFYLGSMYESPEFQLLSGIMVSEENIFEPIYGTIMNTIFGLAFWSIAIKTMIEKFKEFKLQRSVQVNIKDTIGGHENSQENKMATPLQLNNVKYNVSLLNEIQFGVLGAITLILFAFGITVSFLNIFFYATMDDKMSPYQTYLYRFLFLELFLFSLVLPIMYLATKRDVLRFIKC